MSLVPTLAIYVLIISMLRCINIVLSGTAMGQGRFALSRANDYNRAQYL